MTTQIMSKVHPSIFKITHLEILVKHSKNSEISEEAVSLSSNSERVKQHPNKCQGLRGTTRSTTVHKQ